MSQRNRNNILDLCIRKRWKDLERIDEVGTVDETNGFELDFVKRTESRFWSTTPDVGAVL